MKKTVFRYGIYSALLFTVVAAIAYWFGKQHPDYQLSEVIGYLNIILSLVFVYFGIRQYRDKELGGTITYWKAFMVGMLIVLFPSIAFGIYDVIYVKYLDPGFMEKYYTTALTKLRTTLPPDQFAIKAKELAASRATFENIYMQFFLMAVTVVLVGLPITAISALMLYKKTKITKPE